MPFSRIIEDAKTNLKPPSPIDMQDGAISNACLPTSEADIPDDRGVRHAMATSAFGLTLFGHSIVNLPTSSTMDHISRVS